MTAAALRRNGGQEVTQGDAARANTIIMASPASGCRLPAFSPSR
jgi:hypothetical protein